MTVFERHGLCDDGRAPPKPARKKSTVVSLIKHKMKKAAATSAQHARNRA
jgi:hypothetical protein